MKPPICKVCGTEHWSGAPHYSGKPATAAKIDAALTIEGDYRKAKILAASSDAPIASPIVVQKPGRGRPISDAPKSPRAEYQRELMRKRRAAAKEAKP